MKVCYKRELKLVLFFGYIYFLLVFSYCFSLVNSVMLLETQEVLVRFAGFGPEEDEWINIRKHVRPRSLPCESSECVAVLPGDLILCFQVGNGNFFM